MVSRPSDCRRRSASACRPTSRTDRRRRRGGSAGGGGRGLVCGASQRRLERLGRRPGPEAAAALLAVLPPANAVAIAGRARSQCSSATSDVGPQAGPQSCGPVVIGRCHEKWPPSERDRPENDESPAGAGLSLHAPKRTRTSTRLSRTRPSTWRVYQFRHRREGGGEYSPASEGLSLSAGVYTLYEHTFDELRRP